MIIYLLRHAEAEELATSDAARRLTPKGDEQSARVGKFCREHGIKPELVLSSPVTRAWQTAKIVSRAWPDAELVEAPWAACGMDPARAMEELGACTKFPSVMLVGHQPDLSLLAAELLGLSGAGALRVRKALLAGIDASHGVGRGRGVLQFFLPVKMM